MSNLHEHFTNQDVVEGQKLADSLLKRLQSERPQAAMIAFAQGLGMAARACKLRKLEVVHLMEIIMNALGNPEVNSAQEAASRLILPGRF